MKRRLLTLIAFLFCASASGLQQPDNRLELLVFKTRECDPCKQWTAAYNNPFTGLKVSINRAYRMRDAIVVQENLELARKYSVERVPTFVLVDGNGREVHRVQGFQSPAALMNQLMAIPRVPPVQTRPPQVSVDNDRMKRLEEANKNLEDKADSLEDRLADRQKQSAADREKARRELAALKELQEQQASDLKAALEKVKQKAAPVLPAEPECKDGVCTIPPPADDPNVNAESPEASGNPRSLWGTILHHGVGLALDFGLTQAQSEIAVPLAVAGGPIGIAAAGGFMLLKAWRRRKGRHELDTTADDEPAPVPVSRQNSEPTKPQEVDDIIRYLKDKETDSAAVNQAVESLEGLVARMEVQPDGSTEETFWKDGVRLAKAGRLSVNVLGGPAVARGIEDYVARRTAAEHGQTLGEQ
jgi:hypothetical protein